ncbi:MAG: A/G-specific adenine glycosylase [Actinomycetota bacterium]|nr:A/G-specific adenine glycosylase [Actinomycetota bacterium]MDA2970821.1 A/G-specific adenine glycosylase [Actinomycetota bacterium]MDA3002098.1 A/G-specific adenine glycosylase [Actinomycetota bacterium]
MEQRLNDDDLGVFQDALLGWATVRLRELPWRATRDPWGILVSEVMLQQTGVARVMPKWHAFMESFPSPADCAHAALGDVLRVWQGLGYPRRARNLQAAAREITVRHGGEVPQSLDDLLALPGVGPYTARAVLAFAFEDDAAVVDTNVARVLARLAGEKLTAKRAQSEADRLLAAGTAWLWNQGLMELGAMVCRPTPSCDECPWESWCAWRGVGDDPSVGSAGVSVPQGRFEGSDRQARGRLIKALGDGVVCVDDVPRVMDRSPEVADRLVAALVAEGLVHLDPNSQNLTLPG